MLNLWGEWWGSQADTVLRYLLLMPCESLQCFRARETRSLDGRQRLKLPSPGLQDNTVTTAGGALCQSRLRCAYPTREITGASILLRQHSIEVFPVNLHLRHYESAASLGTA